MPKLDLKTFDPRPLSILVERSSCALAREFLEDLHEALSAGTVTEVSKSTEPDTSYHYLEGWSNRVCMYKELGFAPFPGADELVSNLAGAGDVPVVLWTITIRVSADQESLYGVFIHEREQDVLGIVRSVVGTG